MRNRIFLAALLLAFSAVAAPGYSLGISRSCYEELPQKFFSQDVVTRALQLYQVYQNQWYPIIEDLHNFGRNIPAAVREQARRLPKDPFTPPEQPDVINDLYLKELEKLFTNVMQTHNIQYSLIDDAKIKQMFRYILQNNAKVFNLCINNTNRVL
jgi:hypothetical protein